MRATRSFDFFMTSSRFFALAAASAASFLAISGFFSGFFSSGFFSSVSTGFVRILDGLFDHLRFVRLVGRFDDLDKPVGSSREWSPRAGVPCPDHQHSVIAKQTDNAPTNTGSSSSKSFGRKSCRLTIRADLVVRERTETGPLRHR